MFSNNATTRTPMTMRRDSSERQKYCRCFFLNFLVTFFPSYCTWRLKWSILLTCSCFTVVLFNVSIHHFLQFRYEINNYEDESYGKFRQQYFMRNYTTKQSTHSPHTTLNSPRYTLTSPNLHSTLNLYSLHNPQLPTLYPN